MPGVPSHQIADVAFDFAFGGRDGPPVPPLVYAPIFGTLIHFHVCINSLLVYVFPVLYSDFR